MTEWVGGIGIISNKERHEYTLRYLAENHPPVDIDWSMCRCLEFQFAHPPHHDEMAKFLVECHGTDKRKRK